MICDWIITNMPWCVEHIGGMSLSGQIVFAFMLIIFIELGYYAIKLLLLSILTNWRIKKHRFEMLKDWRWERDEAYREWMDYERWLDE